MTSLVRFAVARDNLETYRWLETPLPEPAQLPDGALLVKVNRFAFTANNITYALLGDALKYWNLFPAPDGFGIIPVWGFGDVEASRHSDIAAGEILFGYFPMASHLLIEATHIKKASLRDGAVHRQSVAPVYNAYARVTNDPAFAGRQGDYQALLRPLFMLSFLVDDYLAENAFFGARHVILSSASSKTAFGLAWLLHTHRKPVRTIGLTSSGNADFVKSLGCYDEVVTYDAIESMPVTGPVAYVDMAGSHDIRTRLHRRFQDLMIYSGRVGLTHQDEADEADDVPGAKPSWFFAPDQIIKRSAEWGPGGFEQRLGQMWPAFIDAMGARLEVSTRRGAEAIADVYLDTLKGCVPPAQARMLSLSN